VKSKKNVEAITGIEVSSLSPRDNYNFTDPGVFLLTNSPKNPTQATYAFVNSLPIGFEVTEFTSLGDETFAAIVSYKNNIRYIEVKLAFAESSKGTKRHKMLLLGFLKKEKYIFSQEHGEWILSEMKR
jgi:hypothetical protein